MSQYSQGKCPNCDSSDAYTTYDDGSYCFSCGYTSKEKENGMVKTDITEQPNNANTDILTEINSCMSYPIGSRNISKETVEHFGVRMGFNQDGRPGSHYYPYTVSGVVVGYKERKLPKEGFFYHGRKSNELFGTFPRCELTMSIVFLQLGSPSQIPQGLCGVHSRHLRERRNETKTKQ